MCYPSCARCVFFHDLMHDGEPLKEGSDVTWFIRTGNMCERDPDSAPKLGPEQKEARHVLSYSMNMQIWSAT